MVGDASSSPTRPFDATLIVLESASRLEGQSISFAKLTYCLIFGSCAAGAQRTHVHLYIGL
jgi:hypothetical protein